MNHDGRNDRGVRNGSLREAKQAGAFTYGASLLWPGCDLVAVAQVCDLVAVAHVCDLVTVAQVCDLVTVAHVCGLVTVYSSWRPQNHTRCDSQCACRFHFKRVQGPHPQSSALLTVVA